MNAANVRQQGERRARTLPVGEVQRVIVSTATILSSLIEDADALSERLMKADRLDTPACLKADRLKERTRYAYDVLVGEPYA